MKINGVEIDSKMEEIKNLNSLVIGESEIKNMDNFQKVYARKINECLHTTMENFQLLDNHNQGSKFNKSKDQSD